MRRIYLFMVLVYFSTQIENMTKNGMLWTNSVPLTGSTCFIYEHFKFVSRSDIIYAKQFVDLRH